MALVGATDHGAIYELKPGSKVKDVLALGGGLSALASQQKALLERINLQTSQTVPTAQTTQSLQAQQAPRQVQNLTLNAQGVEQTLQDGDVLMLLPISPAFANAITLQGTVAQPLRHPWVSNMRVSDLILVNHHGEVVYGKYAVNRAAYVLHAAVHTARPDVIAAAHAHSVYGKAFSSLGIQLDALTQDSCAFYENNVVISEHGGAVVFEESAGRDFAEAFGNNRAAIHQNHGHFTVGASVDEAVFWFVCFERCAQAQLAAMAAGTPKHIPHDSAVYTREQAGNAMTGWAHFQPLWQEICRTDPELFD
jgi:ribulose-5-phosphate 4-epimerase/fuculose-1-phosphate aldolase